MTTTEKTATMTVKANVKIDAAKSEVWSVLSKLEGLQDYDSEVAKSFQLPGPREGVGASRQCDLPDGGYVRERVTSWREGDGYSLEVYEDATGHPFTLTDQRVEFALEETDGGTRVEMTYGYVLESDLPESAAEMRQGAQALLGVVLAGLQRLVETGESVPRVPARSG